MNIRSFFSLFLLVFAVCAQPASAQNRPDALKLYRSGNYSQAISVCEQELREKPENLDSYVVLCWSLVKNRQYAEAELQAEKARNISRYDHRIIEILAEAKYFLGKNDTALALFQEYVSLVSINGSRIGDSYYYMGEIFIKLKRYEHADIAFSQAVRIEPLNTAWWIRLGYAREMVKNYRTAASAYQKALELNPLHEEARRGNERVLQLIR
ncbi:MAG: tetratricopeptide repeat protein [Bacteroides sp.]|nr:tetratricopeptide repeat protein [Prevotella sp.]MCM1408442.1 tetratricopeptide repeat protein [Treponema brennaborense]MCM1469396.1 tetratricopeptide repeat protein [Bacteroides sp.]